MSPAPQIGWLDVVEYRDFYDVPRMFVLRHAGTTYLFDSAFDDESDEYKPDYEVFKLPGIPGGNSDWSNLRALGEFVGRVPVSQVEFDETRRERCNERVFDDLR